MVVMKKAYLNRKGYNIKEKYLTKEQIKLIEKDLIVSPKTMSYNEISYNMYRKKRGRYILPRFWAEKHIGKAVKEKFKHQKSEMKFNPKVKLYRFQQHVMGKSLPRIKKEGGGLISVVCGGGKTVMSLYIACQL